VSSINWTACSMHARLLIQKENQKQVSLRNITYRDYTFGIRTFFYLTFRPLRDVLRQKCTSPTKHWENGENGRKTNKKILKKITAIQVFPVARSFFSKRNVYAKNETFVIGLINWWILSLSQTNPSSQDLLFDYAVWRNGMRSVVVARKSKGSIFSNFQL